MNLRLRCSRIALACTIAVVCASASVAAQLQVPRLPVLPAGYVAYAIDNLPAHIDDQPINATNNTPADNPLTDAGATLGRVLFYDKRLSHGDGVSCASCHKQANGFSDPAQHSQGVNGTTARHSMALTNITYYANGKAFWDERAPTLEAQALQPIENSIEMGSTLDEVVAKLSQTQFYPTLFEAAFGTGVGTPLITPERIGKAISQFERSMVSYKSKYDSAFAPGHTTPNFQAAFTPDEFQGSILFHGGGKCSQCHTTSAHVSDATHNVGLPGNTDLGAGDGKFKAPSLRNVEVRGAYMHDGRFTSLVQVVGFYNNGVQYSLNLDPILTTSQHTALRLNLNSTQQNQLIAYLKTLTDQQFLTSPLFSDPFVTLPGDYTGDGFVDMADFDYWTTQFGDTLALRADGDGNNQVDMGDYVIWRKNYGRSWSDLIPGGGGAGGTAAQSFVGSNVPEPAALLLAAVALIGLMPSRRRTAR